MAYVHLHNHSHYSLLDGLPKIKEMVAFAKEQGAEALALTDHGNMYGGIEFYKACLDAEIKPIIGQEVYMAPDGLEQKRPRIDASYNHLILLAKDLEGYKNLMRLTTIAYKDGFYYKPRMDFKTLKEYAKGLICLSGCLRGVVAQAIVAGNEEKAKDLINEYKEIFGDDYYLEVQYHPKLEKQQLVNETIFRLAEETDTKTVATCDCHYLHPEDSEAQDLLVCIGTGKEVSDTKRLDMRDADLSMKSEAEIRSFFPDHPEAIDNTIEVAKKVDLTIPLGEYHFPLCEIPEGFTADEWLYTKSHRGLAERYGLFEGQEIAEISIEAIKQAFDEVDPSIIERLRYELDIIETKKYPEYFLIYSDFCQWTAEKGIMSTTRGSAAGSLVSYALYILNVNPLEYNLPFERFLNPLRPSAPDIDFDIQDDRRHEVIEYVAEKYGHDHVAQIITFGTMAARGAVRDVGRALGMRYGDVDRISKLIPMGSQGFAMTIERAIEESQELKKAFETEPNTRRLLEYAQRVEGCARHSSIHAAGVVVSPGALTEFTALQVDPESGGNVTQYEMKSVEEAGLVKMDFLGIRNLSILGGAIEIIKRTKGVDIDILSIPLDDKKTFQMLARGFTFGVFQLAGRGMTRYLMELQPTTIHDIMAMVALFRPGPMESIPEYITRKKDPSKITYPDPRLEAVLDKSFGIMTYQDDVLMTAITIAGYDWLGADKLRKAMGKKIPAEMAKQKKKFIQGAQEYGGLTEKQANDLFKLIEPFAAYGFNKAHAASYGLVAYQTAYLKANYPVEYMAALMTAEHHDLEKIAEAIRECGRLGIKVLQPDINESLSRFTVIDQKTIRFGLLAVKNIGEGIIDKIIEERKANGSFKDISDLVLRVEDRNLNKKVLENLAKAGAMDAFIERNQLLMNVETILSFAKTQQQVRLSGQSNLFGGANEDMGSLYLESVAVADEKEKLLWEKELLGVYLSSHPFEKISQTFEGLISKMTQIDECPNDQSVCVAGMITNSKTITTRKGDLMAFCMLEDDTSSRELVIFPRTFAENPNLWTNDRTILVRAKVTDRDGQAKLICDKAWELTEETLPEMKKFLKGGKLPSSPGGDGQSQPTGVYIHLSAAPDEFKTNQLKHLFGRYQGQVPVYLKIGANEHKTIKTSFRIDLTEESRYQIQKLSGPNSIRVVS